MAEHFPAGSRFGASTAAYQIEGAVSEDGRGRSIWDKFSHLPGKIVGDDTGDVDHGPALRGRSSARRARPTMDLAHGLGMQARRSARADLVLGNSYNLHPREPPSGRDGDRIAAEMLDAMWSRAFPDPQILGR